MPEEQVVEKKPIVKPVGYESEDQRTKAFIDNNLDDGAYSNILPKISSVPTTAKGGGAYYSGFERYINMPNTKAGDSSPRSKATYRHEFGHHVDRSSAPDGGMWFSSATDYRQENGKDQREVIKSIAKSAADIAKKSPNSSRKRGLKGIAEVFDKDANSVLRSDEYMSIVEDNAKLKEYGQKNIKSGLAKELFDSIEWDKKGSSNMSARQRSVAALKAMHDNYGDNPLIASQVSYNHYLSNVSNITELGQVADVAYAMTKAFGGGHSDKYYKTTYEGIEIFAQIFSTRSGAAHPIAKRLIDQLVPNQVKIVEGLLK